MHIVKKSSNWTFGSINWRCAIIQNTRKMISGLKVTTIQRTVVSVDDVFKTCNDDSGNHPSVKGIAQLLISLYCFVLKCIGNSNGTTLEIVFVCHLLLALTPHTPSIWTGLFNSSIGTTRRLIRATNYSYHFLLFRNNFTHKIL